MKTRYKAEKTFRSNDLIVYVENGRSHNECGPAFVDRRYGCGYWLGGIGIATHTDNHWERENEG